MSTVFIFAHVSVYFISLQSCVLLYTLGKNFMISITIINLTNLQQQGQNYFTCEFSGPKEKTGWKLGQNLIQSHKKEIELYPSSDFNHENQYRGSPDSINFVLPRNRTIVKIVLCGDWFSTENATYVFWILKVPFIGLQFETPCT